VLNGPNGQIWFNENTAGPSQSGGIYETTVGGQVSGALWPTGSAPKKCINPTYVSTVPHGLLAGPDGNVWAGVQKQFQCSVAPYTQVAQVIEKITPAFQFTEYSLHPNVLGTGQLTTGADGRIWFTEGDNTQNSEVGAITTDGVIKEYSAPGAQDLIVSGPDKNLWYVSGGAPYSSLTKMDVHGKNLTTYTDPLALVSGIRGLVVQDGTICVLSALAGNNGTDLIARVSTKGAWQDLSYDANLPGHATGLETDLIVGADGNLWFMNAVDGVGPGGVGSFHQLVSSMPDPVKVTIGTSTTLKVSERDYSGSWTVTASNPSALTVAAGSKRNTFVLTGVQLAVLYVTIVDAYNNVQFVKVTVSQS
jgi:hypothetical protein